MRAACSCPRPQLGRDGCYYLLNTGKLEVAVVLSLEMGWQRQPLARASLYPGEGCFFLMKSGP